jgi:hypothetical protein
MDAQYINPCDPSHTTPATHAKMEGSMGGFVDFENTAGQGMVLVFPTNVFPLRGVLLEDYSQYCWG